MKDSCILCNRPTLILIEIGSTFKTPIYMNFRHPLILYVCMYVCLQDEEVIRARDIHLLGHSLGAHLQAYTGSHYQTISGGQKVL